LTHIAHPVAPWYRRWWLALRRPRLSPESLETIEINIANTWADFFLTETVVDDNEIETQIQAKGLTAPRVTLLHVESCIAYEYYITGDQIPAITTVVLGPAYREIERADITPLSCLTLCVLHLTNGFIVTGDAACVSPENFDAEVGRTVARADAMRKVWALEGYLLKTKLSGA
jgi:Phage protein (N4 Gp49/phage Sf6 gene 66) family